MSVMTLSLRNPRSLDELLNYRLLRLFALSGAPVVRLLEGRYGIARRQWRLLALLAARGALSPSALAEQAQLDRPRTSRALSLLVKKGLVLRTPEPGDHRRACVALSDAGQALVDEVFPQVADINTQVVASLDDTTLQALDRALTLLTAHAQRLNGELAQDVRADRQGGSARRGRWPRVEP